MKILQVRIFYTDDNNISKIVVLGDFTSVGKPYSDVRAISATNRPCSGYEYIKPNESLSNDLINRIADYGMEEDTSVYFPNWEKIYK